LEDGSHSVDYNTIYEHSKIIDPFIKGNRWAVNLALMERREVYTGFWWGNRRERDHLEDQCVDGRIILRWMFR
jgi:hypothetical protein